MDIYVLIARQFIEGSEEDRIDGGVYSTPDAAMAAALVCEGHDVDVPVLKWATRDGCLRAFAEGSHFEYVITRCTLDDATKILD